MMGTGVSSRRSRDMFVLICLAVLAATAAMGTNNYTKTGDSEFEDDDIFGGETNTDVHVDDDDWNMTDRRASITAYLPKPFAFLSMICSYVMIREVLADHKAKSCGPIPRMLLAMAVADFIFSFGYFLGTWPAPSGAEHNMVGNVGNQGFCTFQGFCIQFGLVLSLLVNAALSIYFLLVVRYGWSDLRLAEKEPYAQATIWLLAAIAALYPIPLALYNPDVEFCYIASIPNECQGDECLRGSNPEVHHLIFAFLPFVCLCIILAVMISIFVKVRQIEDVNKKYATSSNIPPPTSKKSSLTMAFSKKGSMHRTSSACSLPSRVNMNRTSSTCTITAPPPVVDRRKSVAVATQALFYALAYVLTYSFALISTLLYHTAGITNSHFDDITYIFFWASAGTFNFCVFARPRTQMKSPEGRFMRSLLFCTKCRNPCNDDTVGSTARSNIASNSSRNPTTSPAQDEEEPPTVSEQEEEGTVQHADSMEEGIMIAATPPVIEEEPTPETTMTSYLPAKKGEGNDNVLTMEEGSLTAAVSEVLEDVDEPPLEIQGTTEADFDSNVNDNTETKPEESSVTAATSEENAEHLEIIPTGNDNATTVLEEGTLTAGIPQPTPEGHQASSEMPALFSVGINDNDMEECSV